MKSFSEHIGKKPEELKEDPLDDLTDLLWVGAAAGGLWAAGKAWDKFGKDAVASLPFAPDKWKAAKVDRKKEKREKDVEVQKKLADDPKSSEKQKAKAAAKLDKLLTPDEKEAQAAADKEKGEKERIKKGDLTDVEKAQQKIDKASKASGEKDTLAKADELDVKSVGDAQTFFDKHGKAPAGYQEYPDDSKKVLDTKTVEKLKKDVADKKEKEAQAKKDAERRARDAAHDAAKDKEPKETKLVPKGTKMTITESNELQAIMALDDVGIKAEINRKGQVVIKKKDKKKAQRALEKSFTKGGWPTLKLEDVEIDEASSKKARNKAADEIEAIADKGGAEAPALFSLASKLRKGTHSTTGLKLSKKVTSILKDNGIKEEVRKQRTAYEVVSEARNRIIETIDSHAVVELYNFMQNERNLQRQKDSIIKNIVRKKKSGKYDHSKAPKLWEYWVENGAKAYDKLYSSPGAKTFDKETRGSVAIQFANEYNAEIDLGNYN